MYECLHVHENLDEYLCEVNISFRMDDPLEHYYPGLDLVYDREHRARLIERGDMDLADKVNNVLLFFVTIAKIVTTSCFYLSQPICLMRMRGHSAEDMPYDAR